MDDEIEYWQKYPISEKITHFLHWMMVSQQKGNTFEHLVIIKMMGIRDKIFDQEFIRYNMERYYNGQDRSTKKD
jgi:hypothetical protein